MKKFLICFNLITLIFLVVMVNITVWIEKIDYAIFYSIWCLIELIVLTLLVNKE